LILYQTYITMKKFVSIGLLMFSLNGFTQQQIRKIAYHDAAFSGGTDALNDYLTKQLSYSFHKITGNGTVYVEFTIEKNGSLSAVKLLKSFDNALDEQVLSAFNEMPLWLPAKNEKGEAFSTKMVLPLRFKTV